MKNYFQGKNKINSIMNSDSNWLEKRTQLYEISKQYGIFIDKQLIEEPQARDNHNRSFIERVNDHMEATVYYKQAFQIYQTIDEKIESKKEFWIKIIAGIVGVIIGAFGSFIGNFFFKCF